MYSCCVPSCLRTSDVRRLEITPRVEHCRAYTSETANIAKLFVNDSLLRPIVTILICYIIQIADFGTSRWPQLTSSTGLATHTTHTGHSTQMSFAWAAPEVKRSVTIDDSQWRALLVMNVQHASNGFPVINSTQL